MLSMTKQSKLKPQDVIKKAVTFFGAKGLGLIVKEEDNCSVYLEGAGGGVRISATEVKKGSHVDVETTEWELQVKDFMAALK